MAEEDSKVHLSYALILNIRDIHLWVDNPIQLYVEKVMKKSSQLLRNLMGLNLRQKNHNYVCFSLSDFKMQICPYLSFYKDKLAYFLL